MKPIYFLNLTNGLEYLPNVVDKDWAVVRLQSSLCEAKAWERVLEDIDYNMLFNLAIGRECIFVDYSARKEIPRAIYQGMEFVQFVLNRVWFKNDTKAVVNGVNTTAYFEQEMRKLSEKSLKRIKYFRRFLNTDKLNLTFETGNTDNDGNYDFYVELTKTTLNK